MTRLFLLSLLALFPRLAAAGGATEAAEAYFRSFTTLRTFFVQTNDDGSIATGHLYIERPGRIRMEYISGANGGLLVASHGRLAIFDGHGNGPATQVSLNKTPLGLILSENPDFSSSPMVSDSAQTGNTLFLTIRDPDHPERGRGTFTFTAHPMRMRSWTITNASGEVTRVVFPDPPRTGIDMPPGTFSLSQALSRNDSRHPDR